MAGTQSIFMSPHQLQKCFDWFCQGESYEAIAARMGKIPDQIKVLAEKRGWEKAKQELIEKGELAESWDKLTAEEFREAALRNYGGLREKILSKANGGDAGAVTALLALDRAEREIREAGQATRTINVIFPGMDTPKSGPVEEQKEADGDSSQVSD